MNLNPEIYVVTVVFNGEATIERTINSVINQTYNNFKYIIIEGKSTDDTLKLISKYRSSIDYLISEKDSGIYDAMNKALKMIISEESFVLFLNSDDYLFKNNSLENIASKLNGYEFIYGRVQLIDLKTNFISYAGKEESKSTLPLGMIQHQATFIKKKLYTELGYFDLSFKISADYDFAVKIFNSNFRIKYVDEVVSVMALGGISQKQAFKAITEKKKIIYKYYKGFVRCNAFFRITFLELPRYIIFLFLNKLRLLNIWRNLKSTYGN
jgi:glycosyltransferase involved in cell wall biosynthesis